MAEMCREKAVSAPDHAARRYCLLRGREREAYRCSETAENLGAEEEDTRVQASWSHFKSHVEVYTIWAKNNRLFDPTAQFSDPGEAAAELVNKVLVKFHQKVMERRYDAKKGRPCAYIKRSIRNRYQDLLRRGRHPKPPTPEECMECFQERGGCSAFGVERPWEGDYERCFRPYALERFDQASATFAVAGLQNQWPPQPRDGSSVSRPVEDRAIDGAMLAYICGLMSDRLSDDQRIVLVETFIHHRTSREIAVIIGTTPGNVNQLRSRGLRRLRRALTSER